MVQRFSAATASLDYILSDQEFRLTTVAREPGM